MLFLPLAEDSWAFRLCLYYGLLVLLLEILVPILLHRRVRIELPRLALRGPAIPLSTRAFQQRRLALQQQVAALQRALAETPRRSPHKRRQTSASKRRAESSPSPSSSPLASPVTSVKVTRQESSVKNNGSIRRRSTRVRETLDDDTSSRRKEDAPVDVELAPKSRPPPMTMSDFLPMRTERRGGFSFDEAFEEEEGREKCEEIRQDKEQWKQAVTMRTARRKESPTFAGRRPVWLVSEDPGSVGYSGPSEAATRLESLIRSRRRQRASTPPVHAPAPPPPVADRNHSPPPVPSPPVTSAEKRSDHNPSHIPIPTRQEVPPSVGQQNEDNVTDENEETKESEPSEPRADFQEFCASFAAGRSTAAQLAATKRKHFEAFGSDVEQKNGGATTAQESVDKRSRVLEYDIEQTTGVTAAASPKSVDKRKHYETFGSDDEREIDDVVATQQVLEKRNHEQAFGATDEKERPQEKTPRIVRRISFGDEIDAMAAPSPKEFVDERSHVKRKHVHAFGMIDDDDEDIEWRESLAFRPHHVG